jgi:heterodisulfide reductase subunit A-like polyferredoxin
VRRWGRFPRSRPSAAGGCRAKVLAAGAGPAGAATALLLARCGVDVSLIERERLFELVFCGEIEGQVRGLQRMVEEAYFVDILTQVASILSALEKVALIPLSRTTSSTVSGRTQMTGRWSTRRWRN